MVLQHSRSFWWTAPFFFFALGYYLPPLFFEQRVIEVPSLLGKTLQECMGILSRTGLNIRLLQEQEDGDLPAGTIIEQIPKPDRFVRANQHVFVTITKRPDMVFAPDFLGQQPKEVSNWAASVGAKTELFWLPSTHKAGLCFAQSPEAKDSLSKERMIVYASSGNETLFVMPDLIGSSVWAAQEVLNRYNTQIEVFPGSDDQEDFRKITEQKPMPGSIVDLSNTLHIQFQIASYN